MTKSSAPNWEKIYRTEYLPKTRNSREIFETHDFEYAARTGPRYDQERAYNTAIFVGFANRLAGQKMIYGEGSISKGMLANWFVRQEPPQDIVTSDGTRLKARHVYDLDESIGSQNFLEMILLHNRRMQLQKIGLLETLMPGQDVLSPIALQGAASAAGQPEFDLGAKRRDKGYMQVWSPTITEFCKAFFVAGDWFASGATSGQEFPEALAVAAGLRKRRPEADMRFFDAANKDVPLFNMAKRYSEYMLWTCDDKDGHYLKNEATALMRVFAIAKMAVQGKLPNANPVFLDGILQHAGEMEKLQKAMEPIILDRIRSRHFEIDLADLEAANPRFVEKARAIKAQPAQQPKVVVDDIFDKLSKSGIDLHRFTDAEFASGDFETKELHTKISKDAYLAVTEKDAANRVAPQVSMRGKTIEDADGRSIFSRRLLALTNDRERLLAGVAVGAFETASPSTANRHYYIAVDDKYGPATAQAKTQLGLAHEDEVPGALGKDFAESRKKNRAIVEKLKKRMQADGLHVVSSFDLLKQIETTSKIDTAAPGEKKISSAGRALFNQTVLPRNVTDFCFPTGLWEQSNDRVQEMVMATRMQLGLQANTPADPKQVRVVNENGHCLTIGDRIEAIWKPLKQAMEAGRDPKDLEEPVTAVAQLYELHRFAREHTMRNRVFEHLRQKEPHLMLPQEMKWDRISPFIFDDNKKIDNLWAREIRPALENHFIAVLRLDHLKYADDFAGMRKAQEALIKIEEDGPLETRTAIRRAGGAAPHP